MTQHVPPNAMARSPTGVLGRRLALRRVRLGLTRKQTAARAGMAPGHLRYLAEHARAAPSGGVPFRPAGAPRTTIVELAGGDAEARGRQGPLSNGTGPTALRTRPSAP